MVWVRDALDGRVEFTGFLPWYQAMSRVRECSVGVVPVLSDGYGQYMVPMKIYDYVTMGVPAVSSRLEAVEDYFPDDALSYVPPGDPARGLPLGRAAGPLWFTVIASSVPSRPRLLPNFVV